MKRFLLLGFLLLALTAFSSQAYAVSFGLNTGSDSYLGMIIDGIQPTPTHESSWVTQLAAMSPATDEQSDNPDTEWLYRADTLNSLYGLLPTATFYYKYEEPEDPFSIVIGDIAFDYILGKYGNVGSHVWYIGNLLMAPGDTIELQPKFGPEVNGGGLSHTTVFNGNGSPVPEPATMLLFGLGLLGMAGFGRKKRKE